MHVARGFIGKSAVVAGCAMLCAVSAAAAGPIGELDVRGSARVAQEGSESSIALRDTTYGWFSGDRIETRSSQAVLNLDAGASFGFAENTVATVSSDQGIAVDLQDGVLLYAIEEEAGVMQLVSGDYTFSTTPADAQVLQVSSEEGGSVGMVQRLEDGSLQVSVHQGVLTAHDSSGSLQYQVVSGEQVSFADGRIEQVEVQVEAAGTERGGVVGWAAANPVLAGLAVAAVGFGTYKVFIESDSDDDPEPVSP